MPAVKKVLFTSHTANFHKFNRPFMRMLKEQGYEVHYASAGEEKVYDTDKHFDIPFERSPFRLGNIKAYFKLKKIIDLEKYDLIHTHTPVGSVITRLAARAARKAGARVIYTCHGAHFFTGGPLLGWILWFPLEIMCSSLTDEIITINKEDFVRFRKFMRSNVNYLEGGVGVDVSNFPNKKISDNDKLKKRRALGLQPNDYVMIYIAELIPRKNHKMLISAMKIMTETYPDTKLLLVGKDSMNGLVHELVAKQDLGENILFLGYRRDIAELCQVSDLAVTTSSQEGLALGVMEALASGLPVVGSRIRGHIDDIELVEPDNVTEFCERVEKIRFGEINPLVYLPGKYHLDESMKFHELVYEK